MFIERRGGRCLASLGGYNIFAVSSPAFEDFVQSLPQSLRDLSFDLYLHPPEPQLSSVVLKHAARHCPKLEVLELEQLNMRDDAAWARPSPCGTAVQVELHAK